MGALLLAGGDEGKADGAAERRRSSLHQVWGGLRGAGDRHRDRTARETLALEAEDGRDHGQAHRPAAREGLQGHGARLLHDLRGSDGVRDHRPSDRWPHGVVCRPGPTTSSTSLLPSTRPSTPSPTPTESAAAPPAVPEQLPQRPQEKARGGNPLAAQQHQRGDTLARSRRSQPGSTEMRDRGAFGWAVRTGRGGDGRAEARPSPARPGAHRPGAGPIRAGTRTGSGLASSDGRTARADRWIQAKALAGVPQLMGM